MRISERPCFKTLGFQTGKRMGFAFLTMISTTFTTLTLKVPWSMICTWMSTGEIEIAKTQIFIGQCTQKISMFNVTEIFGECNVKRHNVTLVTNSIKVKHSNNFHAYNFCKEDIHNTLTLYRKYIFTFRFIVIGYLIWTQESKFFACISMNLNIFFWLVSCLNNNSQNFI